MSGAGHREHERTVHQATNGTGRTAMLKMRLDVWRGAPARVAPRYARNSATCNDREQTEPALACRTRRRAAAIRTRTRSSKPPGWKRRRFAVPVSLLAGDVGRYRPKSACPDGSGRAAPVPDPVRYLESRLATSERASSSSAGFSTRPASSTDTSHSRRSGPTSSRASPGAATRRRCSSTATSTSLRQTRLNGRIRRSAAS